MTESQSEFGYTVRNQAAGGGAGVRRSTIGGQRSAVGGQAWGRSEDLAKLLATSLARSSPDERMRDG